MVSFEIQTRVNSESAQIFEIKIPMKTTRTTFVGIRWHGRNNDSVEDILWTWTFNVEVVGPLEKATVANYRKFI